ncbi:MAG TPA: hypothetical protein VFZ09_41725 [Archangium sp.]|uniref:hypothetical protein n=1 Tax=Archangium sp. TaxID=1872627 RepID=UPI002E348157|nr:hypothetical protein [Archangium sp.]HEX5752798.1 hypothetical protein [Archangium sp.]
MGAGPVEAQSEAIATFTLTDARSGEPVRGARPLGWMSLREGSEPLTDAQCAAKVKTYLGGLLSVQADADLNSYFVLALNHDNSISVINPQLAFSRTKLRSLVTLAHEDSMTRSSVTRGRGRLVPLSGCALEDTERVETPCQTCVRAARA